MGCRRQRKEAGRKVQGTAKAGAARGPARGVREGRRKNAECRMKALRVATGGVREGRRQKAEGRMKRRALGAANGGDRGGQEGSRSIKPNPTKSNQVRPKKTVQSGSRCGPLDQKWRGGTSNSVERAGSEEMLNG